MKILYFNYTTTSLASLLRSLEYGKAVANQGHQVTLCYLHPTFHPPRFYYALMESYQSSNFHVHFPKPTSPVEVSEVTTNKVIGKVVDFKPTLKGLYRQIIASLRFIPVELMWINKIKPDVLLVRPDQMMSFMISSKLKKVPLVLECDGPIEELDQYWGIASKWVEPFDTWRARKAKAVLYISKPCLDLWKKKSIAPEKLFYTPNGAHPDQWKPLSPEKRNTFRKKWGLDESIVIGFSGNLRSWHGVNLLLAAALPLLILNRSLKLFFVGAVEDLEYLDNLKIPETIKNQQIVFTGLLEYQQMGTHIDLADIIVIPYPHHDLFYFSPMKLFEAMCLGKLIVAPKLGQISEMLGELDSPILYDSKDPKGLSTSLEKAILRVQNQKTGEILGADARHLIETGHTWAHRGRVVLDACEFAIHTSQPKYLKV